MGYGVCVCVYNVLNKPLNKSRNKIVKTKRKKGERKKERKMKERKNIIIIILKVLKMLPTAVFIKLFTNV